jgi:hypothetical protein
MANPTVVQRGNAQVEGVAGSLVAVGIATWYPLQQSVDGTNEWDEEVVKDVHGFSNAWALRDQRLLVDVEMVFIDYSGLNSLGNAALGTGVIYLAPQTQVTLSGFTSITAGGTGVTGTVMSLNGIYHTLSGQKIKMVNDKMAAGTLKLRQFANVTQNALAYTTPGS